MQLRLQRRLVWGVAGLFALAAALVPGIAVADVEPASVPESLKSAIKAAVEAKGVQYAGLCREIDQPANLGKYCAFVQALSDTSADVTYGPVMSDEITSQKFARDGDTWRPVPGAPNTGSGGEPAGRDGVELTWLLAGSLLVLGAAGLGTGLRAAIRRG
jgi:hypothetical protein